MKSFNYSPGMIAVVTARTVSGAALSVPHARKTGALGVNPAIAKKHAAYLAKLDFNITFNIERIFRHTVRPSFLCR